jgi:hypothetical protein
MGAAGLLRSLVWSFSNRRRVWSCRRVVEWKLGQRREREGEVLNG